MDDLISGIVNLKQAQLASQVQFAVARKALDLQKFQGNAAVELIQAAARTGSQAGDSLVATATGLGGELDVYA